MRERSPIIVAIDTTDLAEVDSLIEATRNSVSVYKFGLEFYLKFGLETLQSLIRRFDIELFLDLKLHDIPNTVAGASRSIASLKPLFLTVHATGGAKMIRAAADALPETKIAAVTILTSLDDEEMKRIGFTGSLSQQVLALTELALDSGARAVVSSAREVSEIKRRFPSAITITPGIRPMGSSQDDQARTMTPQEAIVAGSDYLVIGRPISASSNPGVAAAEILASIYQ
ncbi:MAG: orotidine-5'-phosphate decarboxylase [Candidatus Nanopelagicaceae bacterium]|jgi:orotidine-5'-phosphate decarboxylase|nr:orotidine-5'-phosphate decarboxylase [Actinomycetota bacterium]